MFVERCNTNGCVSSWRYCHSGFLDSSSDASSGMNGAVSGWPEGFGAGVFFFQMSLRWDSHRSLWWVLWVTSV